MNRNLQLNRLIKVRREIRDRLSHVSSDREFHKLRKMAVRVSRDIKNLERRMEG